MNRQRLMLGRDAQRIIRYHTMPVVEQQNVGAHTFGVCMLLVELTDGQVSSRLLQAALFHDVAEAIVGDTPSPILHRMPAFRTAYKAAEEEVNKTYDLAVKLPDDEAWLLKLADRLELAMFCLEDWARGNQQARLMVDRVLSTLDPMFDHRYGIWKFDKPTPLTDNIQSLTELVITRYKRVRDGTLYGP